MTSNIQQFTLDVSKIAKEVIPNFVATVHRKLAGEILLGVVQMTPVGNDKNWKRKAPPGYVGGHLRHNWQLNFAGVAAELDGVDASRNGDGTFTRELPKTKQIQPFSICYITNPVPYAVRVEHGWSTQAPQGMVTQTLTRILNGTKAIP